MNGNQPYRQDDEWSDLPLPAQEESWAKMEELLDKEKRRRVIPPFFLNCAGITLFSAIIITAAWFAFRPGGFLNEKSVAKTENKEKAVQQKSGASSTSEDRSDQKPENNPGASVSTTESSSAGDIVPNSAQKNNSVPVKTQTDQNNINSVSKSSVIKDKVSPVDRSKKYSSSQKRKAEHTIELSKAKDADKKTEVVKTSIGITDAGKITPAATERKDSATEMAKVISPGNDPKITEPGLTISPAATDTAIAIPANSDPKEIKNKKPSRFSFSAGLGIQQQLRSGTQLAYGSDYYGKKGVFSEHIPSVYFRVHHKENWFAQAEFRFGAPQLVKDYSYARRIKYDTSANNLVVSTMRLRKLYYHQLPFSFNYNLLPRLSVGAGGVYSIFYRAVTEQEVKATNISTGAETYTKFTQRIPGFRDSFFFKSQVQFIFNTEYRWKNFSVGFRYKKDLQPYIKYTKPDGVVDEEMNDAIEVILRYRLWKSKK